MAVGPKLRFEVFKRDSFTCQYCGRSAPDVVLQADHIHPVSKGGDDDAMNLVTSCWECNSGKSNRTLDDDTVIAKQRAQLAELNERREQLEMMLNWREGLRDHRDLEVEKAAEYFQSMTPGWEVNDNGKRKLSKLIREHGFAKVVAAMDVAGEQYLKSDADGKVTEESWSKAFGKISGIIHLSDRPESERRLYYVRGILRNRYQYVDERRVMSMLRAASAAGATFEDLKGLALENRNWTNFAADLRREFDLGE